MLVSNIVTFAVQTETIHISVFYHQTHCISQLEFTIFARLYLVEIIKNIRCKDISPGNDQVGGGFIKDRFLNKIIYFVETIFNLFAAYYAIAVYFYPVKLFDHDNGIIITLKNLHKLLGGREAGTDYSVTE